MVEGAVAIFALALGFGAGHRPVAVGVVIDFGHRVGVEAARLRCETAGRRAAGGRGLRGAFYTLGSLALGSTAGNRQVEQFTCDGIEGLPPQLRGRVRHHASLSAGTDHGRRQLQVGSRVVCVVRFGRIADAGAQASEERAESLQDFVARVAGLTGFKGTLREHLEFGKASLKQLIQHVALKT